VIRTHALWFATALSFLGCTPRHRNTAAVPPAQPAQPAPDGQAATVPPATPPAAPTVATIPPAPTTAPAPTAPTAVPPATPPAPKPLLPPLIGADARRAEVRAVLAELVAVLPAAQKAKVQNIPLVFETDETEINAFAGCENGAPFMATTEGFNLAVEAIAQTRATDELFGTQTYEAYATGIKAKLAKGQSPALPAGIIPAQHVNDAKRQSRAREIYGDIVAFTMGHELAHHYLGHTGCANGQPATPGPNPAILGHLATKIVPVLNQPVELASDNAGCRNTLTAGRARRPGFEWSEVGGLMLFDFFGRLEADAPMIAKVAFLRTHPESKVRIPFVQATAKQWRQENPG
jgi:hypothetical protein